MLRGRMLVPHLEETGLDQSSELVTFLSLSNVVSSFDLVGMRVTPCPAQGDQCKVRRTFSENGRSFSGLASLKATRRGSHHHFWPGASRRHGRS